MRYPDWSDPRTPPRVVPPTHLHQISDRDWQRLAHRRQPWSWLRAVTWPVRVLVTHRPPGVRRLGRW